MKSIEERKRARNGGRSDAEARALPRRAARDLKPGAAHYSAYVGPAQQWDFMGATQFRLLTTLGLREDHRLLDVGCGGLRAGRLLIPYLNRGNYHGIEPNFWLVEDAIRAELGADLITLKQPRFSQSSDFAADGFEGGGFDFIVAQSIFSHAGPEMVAQAFARFAAALKPGGLILATFMHTEDFPEMRVETPGWTYPGCTAYPRPRVAALAAAAGLTGRELPWYHPRQTWHALAHRAADLPDPAFDHHLTGAVLRAGEFAASLKETGRKAGTPADARQTDGEQP